MDVVKRKAAVTAFLDEYKKAIAELQYVIADVTAAELIMIADPLTTNPECTSIQTVLTHVVSSGFSYCVYIQNHRGIDSKRPQPKFRLSANEYSDDLDKMLAYTNEAFTDIYDDELEEGKQEKKIASRWGQYYDIEQMMEHAIVHILRHRRQVVNFKKKLQM
ncbi:MAG: DinB family protein [Ferruginibacter sp.]